jgi:hypothetical protein
MMRSAKGTLWAKARVAYCIPYGHSYALGLDFLAYTGAWSDTTRTWLPLSKSFGPAARRPEASLEWASDDGTHPKRARE